MIIQRPLLGLHYNNYTIMRRQKFYKNGLPMEGAHHKEVREVLQAAGRRINFGPFLSNREYDGKYNRLIESFTLGNWELFVIEYECMSFSLSDMSVSEPHLDRIIWYQPLTK